MILSMNLLYKITSGFCLLHFLLEFYCSAAFLPAKVNRPTFAGMPTALAHWAAGTCAYFSSGFTWFLKSA
jgi:hypothetical protein